MKSKQLKRFFLHEKDNFLLLLVFSATVLYQGARIIWEQFFANNSYNINYYDTYTIIISSVTLIVTIIGVFLAYKQLPKRDRSEDGIFAARQTKAKSIFHGFITAEDVHSKSIGVEARYPGIISRENHCAALESIVSDLFESAEEHKLNCIFLTGDSGSGKSIFLQSIMKPRFKKKYTRVIVQKDEYQLKVKLPHQAKGRCVVIYDQFEDALGYNAIHEICSYTMLPENKNTLFIFSFRQDYLDRVLSDFIFELGKIYSAPAGSTLLNHQVYFLSADHEDIERMKEKIIEFTDAKRETIENIERNYENAISRLRNPEYFDPKLSLLYTSFKAVQRGIKPLVSFFLIGYIIENFDTYLKKPQDISKYLRDPEGLIQYYLNDYWVEKFPNRRMAQAILYLMSDGKEYTVRDIRGITYAEPECFINGQKSSDGLNIVDALNCNMFVQTEEKRHMDHSFRMKHDYAAAKVYDYCVGGDDGLTPEMKGNVEYYRDNVKKPESERKKNEILKRYSEYWDKDNKFVYYGAIVLCVLVSVANILCSELASSYDRMLLMLMSLCCLGSTYYVYNYCKKILRVFPKNYSYPPVIAGIIMVTLCYIVPKGWAVFLGLEVFILVYSIKRYIVPNTESVACDEFKKNCRIFAGMAAFIVALGVFYIFLTGGFATVLPSGLRYLLGNRINVTLYDLGMIGYLQELVYYALFLMYVCMSVSAHINVDYMFARLGMANMINDN